MFVTDLVSKFISTDLIPALVAKTLELHNESKTTDEIVTELIGTEFETLKKSHREPTKTKTPVAKAEKVDPVSVADYALTYMDSPVCLHVFGRGDDKGKVCVYPLAAGSYDPEDRKTHWCAKHVNVNHKDDIDVLVAKLTDPAKNEDPETKRATKIIKTFPKGAPAVLNKAAGAGADPTAPTAPTKDPVTEPKPESTPVKSIGASLGKLSIKDKIALKTKSAASTPQKEDPAPEQPAPEETPAPVEEETPEPVAEETPEQVEEETPAEETPDQVGEETPEPVAEETPEPAVAEKKPVDTEEDLDGPMADNDGNAATIEVKGVDEFNWILFTPHDLLVFDGEFTTCHGRYRSDTAYAVGDTAEISSAWKNLLTPPTEKQMAFVKEQDLVYAPLESD